MTSPALSPALSGPQALIPLPQPATPASPAPAAATGSFARQLQQAQTAPDADPAARNESAADAKADADSAAKSDDAVATPDAPTSRDDAPKARTALARWLTGTARPGTAAGPDTADTDSKLYGTPDKTQADKGRDDAVPTDGSAAAWIASLLPARAGAVDAPRTDAAAGSALPASTEDAALATVAGNGPRGKAVEPEAEGGAQALSTAQRLAPGTVADRPGHDTHDTRAGDGSLQALRERLAPAADAAAATSAKGAGTDGSAATPVTQATPPLPAFAAELAKATQAVATGAPSPAPQPTAVQITPPVTSPEFVPRLTGELAVLARDGVQEARVQVNPVELGPIAVQIKLEGQAAQVHLAVASEQTRQVLEQAMPSLAAALRENGLTLTGGGVFQQARQNGRDAPADGSRGGTGRSGRDAGGDEGPAAVAAPTRRVRLPGAVDLYA